MPRKENRLLLAIGVAALSVLPYLNGLHNGFTFDDVPIVAENARLRPPARLGAIAATDWWDGTRPMSRLYRPLTMASFAADYAVARAASGAPPPARLQDAAAVPFHAQNILWHAAASVALLWLVLEAFASPMLAAVTAALFAAHPVHTEAVDGIVGRAELISACLGFLSLLVAWRTIRDDSAGMRRPALAGGLLLGALLAKEQAIALPVVLIAGIALQEGGERRGLIARASVRRLLVAQGVAVVGYVVARAAVLGSLTGVGATAPGALNVDNPIAGASGLARLLTPVRVFGEVLRLLVVPRTLSADYSYAQIPPVASPDGATAACAVALCGLAAGAILLRRRAPAVALGIFFFFFFFFFFATWLLTSNFVATIGTILGERLLYLPSAGACLAIAAVLVAVSRRLRAAWLAPAAAVVLVLAGAGRTWARNPDWKDNLTLFASATAASPRSCKAWNGYASELLARGRAREALPAATRSLEIYPRYPDAHQTLAKIDRALANDESAGPARDALRTEAKGHARVMVELFSSGVDGGPGLADAWNTIGAIALDEGRLDEAESAYRASVKSRPDFVASINGLGVVLSMRAERAADPARQDELLRGAIEQFERAEALDPAFPQARRNAARAYLGIGSVHAAQAEGEADPQRRQALLDEAIAAFQRASELAPDDPAAQLDLAVAFLRRKREPAQVALHFREYLRLDPTTPRRAQVEQTIREMDALAVREGR